MMKHGWSSPPHAGNVETGAQVFVFFEGGDINYPIYFAFAQSGKGWISEHPNQHVFKSDNVRIRIDENVKDERSTCKFDSYNSKNSKISKANLERDCTKHDWKFDQEKGVIKDLETRIDIEVMAENLNAINLNIHGNVNMKLDGNWFVEHYGNKYEYHEGDTYIKQKGSTYIEQEGVVRIKHEGDKSVEHIGHYYLTHNGDTMETHTGTYFMMVDGDVTFTFNSEYKLTVGKNYSETVKLSKSADIFGSKNLNIYESYNEIIANNKFISAEGFYDLLIGESITTKSYRGNILLETEGDFELTKEGKITPVGFTNIGTKGNIQIISTFGNINLQCKKDDSKAQFNKKSVTIPWNPSFVTQLEKMAILYPSFNKTDCILKAEALSDELTSFDISSFVKLFKDFTSTLLIYDGLPVLLPTRMIIQNPNIPIPKNVNDVSWVPNFRSEASDWKNISPSDFWKLPGRMMGNINIETWSGDINIKTNSELGCAGNINIEATESAGTLPGYKIGTVNIKNEGRKRIYPDPRDLFLDSDFQSRFMGQFKLFSHASNPNGSFRKSVLPSAADSILKGFTGCSLKWVGTNYDDFYKLYGSQILTKGGMGALTSNSLKILSELSKKEGPKLGCTKCISDYLLGLPGIQDICYSSEEFEKMASEGFHETGFFKYNPFDIKNPRGTFNIEAGDFDKISIGDGHAVDSGFIDREFVGPNIGAFNLSSSGDFNHEIGRNYKFKCNTSTENGEKIVNYIYTEKWYDDVWSSLFEIPFNILKTSFNIGIGGVGSLKKNGDFTITKISKVGDVKTSFKFLPSLPHNEFLVIGYTVSEYNKTGNKLIKSYEEGFESSINLGFDITNVMKVLKNPSELEKRQMIFTDYIFTKNIIDNTTNIDEKVEEINRKFTLKLKDPYPSTVDVRKEYLYNDIKVENSALNSTEYGDDNLYTLSGINEIGLSSSISKAFPTVYFNINDYFNNIIGHGYDKDTDYISYLKFESDKDKPDITYIDYIENELKSVVSDLPEHSGESRNISSLIYVDSFRSNSEDITWSSAINKKTLNLISDEIFVDEIGKKEIAINNIKINLSGNAITSGKFDPEKYNTIAYEAKDFPINEIFINNGRITNGSSNKIEISNGCGNDGGENPIKIEKVKNEIFVNNGKEVNESFNNIKIENGTNGIGENTNRYVIKNGFGEFVSSTYDIYNGNENTSLKYYVDKTSSTITEYSANTKISNIGVIEQKNVGQTQNIKIGKEQTLDIGETQKTIIGTSKTIDVPTYIFNTMDMTMNNVNSTSINTTNYKLICKGNCNIGVVGSYELITGANITILALGMTTVGAVGTTTLGSVTPKGATNMTGLFTATGYLTGHSTWAATAGCAPLGASAPNYPKEGPGGTNPSSPTPPTMNNPESFPGVETPKTPYLFTKLLKLYVEYLEKEFKYLLNIFK